MPEHDDEVEAATDTDTGEVDELSPLKRIPLFSEFIAEHRGGQLDAQLAAALAEVSQAVQMQDKAGKVTLTLSMNTSGQAGLLFVADEIKVSMPQPPAPKAVAYVNDVGGLSQDDPRRLELPFAARLAKEGPLADELVRLEKEQAELASKNDRDQEQGTDD